MDFSNCCRLCLSKEGRQVPHLRSLDDGLNARISSYLCIEVSQFDGLPKEICHRCECQLNVWHYFKVDCEVSQRKLRRWHRTHCNSSTEGDRIYECDREIIQIKEEPNDIDLSAEQYVNHSEDQGSNQFSEYGLAVEDEESNENHFTEHHGDSDQSHSNPERLDDSDNSCNLVISATTSILPEENASCHISDGDGKNDRMDSVSLASERNFDTPEGKAQIEACDNNSNGVVFVDNPSQRHTVIEVNLENSNDGLSSPLKGTHNHVTSQISNFADTDLSQLSTETMTPSTEDQLGGVKIKEEARESLTEPGPYTEENSLSTECFTSSDGDQQPTRKRSMKISPVSSISGLKRKRPSLSKQFQDSLDNNLVYHFNLPKINNDAFDENTKYCKICQKSFQNSNLWRHMANLHSHVNPFQCGGCRSDFPGRRELVTHRVRTVSKYCREGKQPDVDMSYIICHGKIRRGKLGRFQCRECKEKFSQLGSAKTHIRVHTGEKPFFCYKCNEKEFRLKKSAYKHVAACNGKNDTPPVLPKEKKKVLSSSVAVSKVLKQKAMKNKENRFKCKKCGKVFHNGVGYANHLRVECLRRCFSCSKHVASKSFYKHFRKCLKSSDSLISAMENTNSVSSKSSTTSTLESGDNLADVKNEPDMSENKTNLQKTKVRRNARVTQLVDMSFKELVNQHRDEEGKLKEGKCKICCKTLNSYKSMHAHLMKHCSKAFRCDICSLSMSLRATYKAHIAKCHGGHQDFSKAASSSNVRRGPGALVKGKHTVKFSGFNISKLKCEICLKVFSSVSSLKFHKQTHKRIKCGKCEITFPSNMEKSHVCTPKIKVDVNVPNQEQAASHVLPESRAVQYTCLLCKKKFHTRKMLYQHKKMHIKMKIYKCKICGNSYSDAGALQKHKEEEHASELEMPLNETDVSERHDSKCAVDTVSTEVRATVNTQVKLWKCGVCFKEYSRMDTWSKHMKLHRGVVKTPTAIHKPQNPGVLYCSLCDKALESKASFIRHKGWHSRWHSSLGGATVLRNSPVKIEPSTSEDIVKKLSSQESNMSSPPMVFKCDVCPKKFPTQKSLRIHAHYHNKYKKKDSKEVSTPHIEPPQLSMTHKCEVCAKTFTDLPSFSTHMNTHMGSSTETTGLSKDLTKPEPMQCKLCNKEYRSKKSLKYHMMGHSGEKPYKCRSCSNQYSNPNALAKHEKERHTPILRPFCCIKCKTSFILKEDLLAHHEKCTH